MRAVVDQIINFSTLHVLFLFNLYFVPRTKIREVAFYKNLPSNSLTNYLDYILHNGESWPKNYQGPRFKILTYLMNIKL